MPRFTGFTRQINRDARQFVSPQIDEPMLAILENTGSPTRDQDAPTRPPRPITDSEWLMLYKVLDMAG